jgi:hypothetical protein
MPEQSAIERYVGRLERRLPRSAWRLRVLAEVEDHLRTATDLGRGELGRGEAERRAVERFGSVESLARQLSLDYAAGTVRRASQLHAVLFVALAGASLVTWNGPWLTGHAGGLPQTLATFVLVQVAWTAAGIAWLRAWLSGHLVHVPPAELRLVLRGAATAVASLGLALLVRVGEKLTGAAAHTSARDLAGLMAGATVAAVVVAWAAWRMHQLGPLLGDDAEPASDLAGLGRLAGGLVEARRPAAGRTIGRCWRLLDVERHPWRLVALTCAACAPGAFQVGAAPDGFWPALAARGGSAALVAGAVSALVEVCAVLAGFLALRGPLGLWVPSREAIR